MDIGILLLHVINYDKIDPQSKKLSDLGKKKGKNS